VRATAGSDTIAVGGAHRRESIAICRGAQRPTCLAGHRSLYGSVAADLTSYPYIFRAVDPDSGVRRTC